MFPLIRTEPVVAGYVTLSDTIAQRGFRITEVSDSGSVPELKVSNGLERPVLLVDGEELVGAKQNRVLNLSILIPAETELLVPVSCVEAGRWHHTSREFKSAGRAQYAAGRASRVNQVSDSLAARGSRASNQAEVWSNIAGKAQRMAVSSDTSAMSDIYHAHESMVEDHVTGLSPVQGQVGAVFATDGRIVGLDVFDAETTLAALLPTLVRSHALDAIESKSDQQPISADQVVGVHRVDWRSRSHALQGHRPGRRPAV